MHIIIVTTLLLTVAYSASIPEPQVTKSDDQKNKQELTDAQVTPTSGTSFPADQSINNQLIANRDSKQLYPAGFQAPGYAPEKSAYNPLFSPAPIQAQHLPPQFYYNSYYSSPSVYPSPFFGQNYYYPLREESSSAEGSYWGQYFPSSFNFGQYFNYPSWFGSSESENQAAAGANPTPANQNEVEGSKGNSIVKAQKIELKPNTFPLENRFRLQPAPVPQPQNPQYILAEQPQFYGHYSPFQVNQDPSKLTTANNGAVSSYLFLRNQPQLPVYQNNQQKFVTPAAAQSQNVKDSHQQFVDFSKKYQEDQSKRFEKQASSSESNTAAETSSDYTKKDSETPVNSPIAQAKPKGLAVAGEGGVADSSPSGTALVGKKGMALAAPSSIAIAGPESPLTLTIDPTHKKTKQKKKPVAYYSEQRGYHIKDSDKQLL